MSYKYGSAQGQTDGRLVNIENKDDAPTTFGTAQFISFPFGPKHRATLFPLNCGVEDLMISRVSWKIVSDDILTPQK
jgi:hypothetical protein